MADEQEPLQLGQSGDEERAPWAPIGIGVVLIVLVIGALIFFSRSEAPSTSGEPHPYAASLKFADLKLSTAENFVGGSVTYLDGTLTNSGDKTVSNVSVELTFRNTLGEVVQKESMRVMALDESGPYPDIRDLRAAPIAPGKSRPIRLTLEHISADWNRAAPDIKITNVSTK
jgi:hypothetical protein